MQFNHFRGIVDRKIFEETGEKDFEEETLPVVVTSQSVKNSKESNNGEFVN